MHTWSEAPDGYQLVCARCVYRNALGIKSFNLWKWYLFCMHRSISICLSISLWNAVRAYECSTQSSEHWMCSRFARLLVLFLLMIPPDQLNGSTNDSTFSIIVAILSIVGQIYRATSANTINFISIISFRICCFFHNCCASCFPFHFHLFSLSR